MKLKRFACLLAATAVAGVAAATASADYPPRATGAQVSKSAVKQGGSFLVRGDGFRRGSVVRVSMRDSDELLPLARLRADAFGAVQARLVVPREAEDGRWVVVLMGIRPDGSWLRLTAAITVR